MTDLINTDNHTTEHKVTAEDVENNCPATLQDLGKRIAVYLEKARRSDEKAKQYYTTIAQHLAEAQRICDDVGFKAFREKFFPDLGKSRVYELLQIATNKKSIEQINASRRERVAKHRAKKATEFRYGNGKTRVCYSNGKIRERRRRRELHHSDAANAGPSEAQEHGQSEGRGRIGFLWACFGT